MTFDNVTIENQEAPILYVIVDHDVNIYITGEGLSTISYGFAVVEIHSTSYAARNRVNIYVISNEDSQDGHIALRTSFSDPAYLSAEQGVAANFYINGDLKDSNYQ